MNYEHIKSSDAEDYYDTSITRYNMNNRITAPAYIRKLALR